MKVRMSYPVDYVKGRLPGESGLRARLWRGIRLLQKQQKSVLNKP